MTKLFEENLRDSTVTDRTKHSPSGGRKAVENQPEPDRDRGPGGMSGIQQDKEELWSELIQRAWEVDDHLGGTLEGMRIYGLKLQQRSDGPGWELVGGDYRDDWEADREKYLYEHREELTELLATLGT